ncbi:MAG: hypothetical protein ACJ79K_12215 [Gemmatimonadaceae bacterium]
MVPLAALGRRRAPASFVALLAASLVALLLPIVAHAQRIAYIPLDDPSMGVIDALVQRGALRGLSSIDRPYYAAAVRDAAVDALDVEDRFHAGLVAPRAWYQRAIASGEHYAGPDVRVHRCESTLSDRPGVTNVSCVGGGTGMRAGDASIELDPFITAQTTGGRELLLGSEDKSAEPGADVRFGIDAENVGGVARLRIDRALKRDPEFAGQKDRSVAARMEEAYIGARWHYVSLATGRVSRNWGPAPLDGLQVGSYADSYDHLYLRFGTDALNISSIIARLDDMTLAPDSVVAQRYFTAHRLTMRWRQLEVAASEAIVYGGEARGFEPSLANPLAVLDLAQYTAHQSMNVNYGLDVALRTTGRGYYAAQFLLDDFQIDRCDPNCKEPASTGLTFVAEELPTGTSARAFGSYTRVTNLTYRAPNPWERYSYLGLGLGRGQSDYDELRAGIELAPPLGGPLRLYAASRRQGEGDYRLPFPAPADYAATPPIFAGVVEHVHRAGARWTMGGRVALDADLGYDWTANADHVAGRSRNGFVGRLRVTLMPALGFAGSFAQ